MHPWGNKGGKWLEAARNDPEKLIGNFLGKLAQHHQKKEEKKKRFQEDLTQQMNEQMNQQLDQKMSELTLKMQQQQQEITQQTLQNTQVEQIPPLINQQSEIISTQPQSLVESQIMTSQISNIKPTSETHKIIMIHKDQFSYPIIPYSEKFEDDESQLELKKSVIMIIIQELEGIIVGQTKRELTPCEYYTKCKKHETQIEYVCLEPQCKSKNQYLMCPKCVKYHKQHNFQELAEILFFGQQRMEQFDETDILIAKMQFEVALKLKIIKSKSIQELEEIEKKFENGFEELKRQMLASKEQYRQMMVNLQQGGLENLAESIDLIYVQQQPSQNSSTFKGFISNLQQAESQLKQYEHLLFDQVTNIRQIKVDNYEFQIDFQKVQTFQDLYQQIKLLLIKQDLQNLIYRELVWMREKEAIKLQGNSQLIDIDEMKNVQIISYPQF